MEIKTVGVVGAGLMGSGIVETAARHGYDVIMREVDQTSLERGRQRIQKSMSRAVERGKMTDEERNVAQARIKPTTDLQDLAPADLVIEAIIENLGQKKELFAAVDKIVSPGVIIASNTSSVSITALAAATTRQGLVAGMHFFNPVPVMKLVEIIKALQTTDQTVGTLKTFAGTLDKTIVVAKDTPGFIVNFLLVPYMLDAVRAVEDDVSSAKDIDTAMTLGTGVPMGPLTLLDFVGLDTTLYIADVMYEEFKDKKYAAPPLLRKMVAAGYHGKKSGRGFYEYAAKS
ncbi:MAG: 3-hydroxyacyl-CoA dehydrogenase family protein [Chloroflexota bacterium]